MVRKILLWLLALALLLPLPAVAASETPNHYLVILLDVSLSVRMADSDGQILNNLRQLVGTLDSQTRVCLIRYANEIIDISGSFDPDVDEQQARLDVINKLVYDEKKYSDTGLALDQACSLLSAVGEKARKSIVLVSDDEIDINGDDANMTKAKDSQARVETVAEDISGGHHIYYLHIGYAPNPKNTFLDAALTASDIVTRCELSGASDIATQIDRLELLLKNPTFELLTPKYVDNAWVESDIYEAGEDIELYAFFTSDDQLVADVAYLSGFTVTVAYDGTESEMALAKAQDSFYAPLRFDDPGEYQLTVTARSKDTGVTYNGTQTLTIGGTQEHSTIASESEPLTGPGSELMESQSFWESFFESSTVQTYLPVLGVSGLLSVIVVGTRRFKKARAVAKKEIVTDKLLLVELLDENQTVLYEDEFHLAKNEKRNLQQLIRPEVLNARQQQIKQPIWAINRVDIANVSSHLTILNHAGVNCYPCGENAEEDKVRQLAAGQSLELRRSGVALTTTVKLTYVQSIPEATKA